MMVFLFSGLLIIRLVTIMKNVFFKKPSDQLDIWFKLKFFRKFKPQFYYFRFLPLWHTVLITFVEFNLIFFKMNFPSPVIWRYFFGGFSKSFIYQHIIADVAVGISLGLISISDRLSIFIHLWTDISNGEWGRRNPKSHRFVSPCLSIDQCFKY